MSFLVSPCFAITACARRHTARKRHLSTTFTCPRPRSKCTAGSFCDSCDPISLADWRDALRGAVRLPKRPALVTFDDGYRSVLTKAAPILAAYDLPAVFAYAVNADETAPLVRRCERARRRCRCAGLEGRDYESWSTACADTRRVDESDPRVDDVR
jgi:hypothetical protein